MIQVKKEGILLKKTMLGFENEGVLNPAAKMNNLNPIIFLVPVIALLLASLLYFSLLKRETDKKTFNGFVFAVTVLAFLLNFTWELVQMPLYKNSSFSIDHVAFCALGSIADAIMVLLLYFGLAFIFKNPLWIQHLTWQRIVIVILIGGTGGILGEIRHLSLGSWAYDDSMPIIPFVNAGVAPVLQFMILPLLIYVLGLYYLKIKRKKKE